MERDENIFRSEHEKLSNEVHKLLEKEFYLKLTDNYIDGDTKAIQISGIDVIFDYNGHTYRCDEKAAVTWRNLKTYTLELSFINRAGKVMVGWFLDDRSASNSYILVWVEDEYIEFVLLRKDKIWETLKSMGITKEYLQEKAQKIRNNPYERKMNWRKDGYAFTFNENKNGKCPEKPINLQLPKELYISISDYHSIIKTDYFKGKSEQFK